MNFSAEKASRKWACGGLACEPQMVYGCLALQLVVDAAAAGLPGVRPHEAAAGRGQAALGRPVRRRASQSTRGRCASRVGAVAEAASGRGPCSSRRATRRPRSRRPARASKPARTSRARAAAAALGLPAGADRRDRDRAQHSRYPRRRRLRRRGSGAAGGGGAAGQAAGRGKAGGDPALHHGLRDRGLDSHRHGAAGASASAAPSAISTISIRSNAAAATASSARKLSEHGRANALDVRALKLANGQSISLTDRTVPREVRESVLHSVCARFSTVLGPGSDWYHEDHIHLDLMERRNNYRICQWNVWDPLPQIAPLLPAERPEEAPPREVAARPESQAMRARTEAMTSREVGLRPTVRWPMNQSRADGKPRNKKAPVKPALLIVLSSAADSVTAHRPVCRRPAAPSANCTASRHASAPAPRRWCRASTRSYRSITSSLVMRMQPDEIEAPIYSGWLVP